MDAKKLTIGAAAAAILAIGGIGAAAHTQSATAQNNLPPGQSASFSREIEADDDSANVRNLTQSDAADSSEARDAALNEVPGEVVGVSLDDEYGSAAYEVDIYGEDGRLHEVKVAAATDDVIRHEIEDTEDSAETARLLEGAGMDHESAANAALNEVPGQLLESKLDDEDGRAVYEVGVLGEDGMVHELTVDAGNGNILYQETEDADD